MSQANPDYINIHDFRYNPFTGVYTPKTIGSGGNPYERRKIPSSSPYVLKLFELPQLNSPTSTEIWLIPAPTGTQLTETDTSPSAGEFRVDYDYGYVEFNSAQSGQEIDIAYYGLGTINQEALWLAIEKQMITYGFIFSGHIGNVGNKF